jgi:hypothetical protein
MDFVDATFITLADESTRADVFDQLALEHVVAAGYNADALAVEGPFEAVFDELTLGVAVPRLAAMDGTWNPVGGVERMEASFRLTGIGPDPAVRIDAVWRGAVVARVVAADDRIVDVQTTFPALGTIDADIEADLGGLPTDPDDLESARRERVLERLRTGLDQPDRLAEGRLADLLAGAGVGSVGDLVERTSGVVAPGAVKVGFTPEPATPPPAAPLPLPVSVLILVRGEDVSVTQLLADTKLARDRLEPLALQRPADPALRRRRALLAAWIVPAEVFDDEDWPGATNGMTPEERRIARRTAAAAWLGSEGIAVAAPP